MWYIIFAYIARGTLLYILYKALFFIRRTHLYIMNSFLYIKNSSLYKELFFIKNSSLCKDLFFNFIFNPYAIDVTWFLGDSFKFVITSCFLLFFSRILKYFKDNQDIINITYKCKYNLFSFLRLWSGNE